MKGYLTDEELELFIEQLEQKELYAPRHMKEQILSQAFPKKTAQAQPESGGGEGSVRFFPDLHDFADAGREHDHASAGRRHISADGGKAALNSHLYRLKILAGMAAALILLLIFPLQGESRKYGRVAGKERPGVLSEWRQEAEEAEEEDRVDINYMLNESTREMNRRINSWFDRLLRM